MLFRILTICLIVIYYNASSQNQANFTIDHISIVVSNLDEAKKTFKDLGFTIKPGRTHANSIENAHIKFENGTAIELITALQPLDELSGQYFHEKSNGDGPLFLSMGMDDHEQAVEMLKDFQPILTEGGYYKWLTFPKFSGLDYMYFMKYTNPPIDKKEHLEHDNGVSGIKSIKLSKDSFNLEKNMFSLLSLDVSSQGTELENGYLYFDRQQKNRRPISSITLQVANLRETMEWLPNEIQFKFNGNSIILPMNICHGVEFVFEEGE